MKSEAQRGPRLVGTDRDWEKLGKKDPYWAVVSAEKYRQDALDDSALSEFFLSGREHLDQVLCMLRNNFRSNFSPGSSLDFGCGVGRIAIPLAGCSQSVTAVDVSPAMLEQAARNAASQGAQNIGFLQTSELSSIADGSMDLVHSYMVFQHILPLRGERLFRELLRKLNSGGMGALHLTVDRDVSLAKRAVSWVRGRFRPAHWIVNLLQGRPVFGPAIYMYTYSPRRLLRYIRAAGCKRIIAEPLQHGSHVGIMFYFEKT